MFAARNLKIAWSYLFGLEGKGKGNLNNEIGFNQSFLAAKFDFEAVLCQGKGKFGNWN